MKGSGRNCAVSLSGRPYATPEVMDPSLPNSGEDAR